MVGLDSSPEPVDITHIPLTYHGDLYLPPKEYSSCAPIPEEWIESLPHRTEGMMVVEISCYIFV